MGRLKNVARTLIRTVTGLDPEGMGGGSIALISRKHADLAWFAYRTSLRLLLEQEHIDLVVDVGANKGQFATSIRPFYRGDILSFEPVSDVFEQLARAAASDPKWSVHRLAVGDIEGQRTIHVPQQTEFSSLLVAAPYSTERFGSGTVPTREETVTVRRLEAVLDQVAPSAARRRIFLKMDTQGYDLHVFGGVGHRLHDVVAVQSELSLIPIYEAMPHWTESITHYENAGFSVVGMFPVTHDHGLVIEYDCLLRRPVDATSS